MNLSTIVTNQELCLLALVTLVSLGGSYFVLWRNGKSGSIAGGCILMLISGTLALRGEHSLLFNINTSTCTALALGLAFGLSFPCCVPRKRAGALQLVATAVVLVHCALDGHVVREATSTPLIALLLADKFRDGADGRILSGESRSMKIAGRLVIALATPLGFLLIPESLVNPLLHNTLFAAVTGFNIGNAVHLFRHAVHLHKQELATC